MYVHTYICIVTFRKRPEAGDYSITTTREYATLPLATCHDDAIFRNYNIRNRNHNKKCMGTYTYTIYMLGYAFDAK